jgi:hypothetical protein
LLAQEAQKLKSNPSMNGTGVVSLVKIRPYEIVLTEVPLMACEAAADPHQDLINFTLALYAAAGTPEGNPTQTLKWLHAQGFINMAPKPQTAEVDGQKDAELDVISRLVTHYVIRRIRGFSKTDGGPALFSIVGRMNHSCDPNVEIWYNRQGHAVVMALREIAPMEEITWSYVNYTSIPSLRAAKFMREMLRDRLYGKACLCKSPRCMSGPHSKEKEIEADAAKALEYAGNADGFSCLPKDFIDRAKANIKHPVGRDVLLVCALQAESDWLSKKEGTLAVGKYREIFNMLKKESVSKKGLGMGISFLLLVHERRLAKSDQQKDEEQPAPLGISIFHPLPII